MLGGEHVAGLFDAVSAGLIVVDRSGTIVYWNAWMEAASGKSPADVLGTKLEAVFPGRWNETLEQALHSATTSGASTLLSNLLHPNLLPLKTDTGGTLVHDLLVKTLRTGDSVPHCLIQVFDVSNAARREQFLRTRHKAQYFALVDNAPDVIINVDSDRIIRLANPAVKFLFGYTSNELVGQHVDVLFAEPDAWTKLWDDGDIALIRGIAVELRRKDGSTCYGDLAAAHWGDGARLFTSVILRDTSERRKTEIALRDSERRSRRDARTLAELNETLRQSTEELNALDRRKDEFLATLAHELRNPLAPLRNGLELLTLALDDPEAMKRTCHMMEMQLSQMVRLIDDLLDVSRINNNIVALEKESTTLGTIIRQALETTGPLIDSRGHELSMHLPSEDIPIDVDTVRLTQVFSNILNNAAKYTPREGKLAIKADRDGTWLTVRISDSGVGIPANKLEEIFEMFTRVDQSLERDQGGLGIGLSLVRRLVEMHDGTVEARSDGLGTGSEFVVRLPVQSVEPITASQATGAEASRSRRVLVADDNRDSAATLAALLRLMEHETATAHDGLEALRVAEEFLPEIAFIDIGMPNLNGYDTARQIRRSAWGRDTFLVALTGWGQDEDKRRSSEAGFDVHCVKPVNLAEIKRLMMEMDHSDT
jgi:PAS domain S-box-containing protein